MELPVEKIHRRPDARAINADTVASLAESIGAVGLINPIRVRAVGDGWELIAGAHRLEACKALGLVEVTCAVVEDDDLHAELAMIDENLCRAELSPSDRALQTARRKAIYGEIHKETQHGGNTGPSGQFVHTEVDSFAADTAKAIGKDERTVRRDAERGEKVIAEVFDMIRGTKLDTGTYLDKLKSMPGSEQYRAAQRDLAFLKSQERDSARQANKIRLDADIRHRAAKLCAEMIVEHIADLDAFTSNLDLISTKDLRTEIANLAGASIMDRRHG